MGKPKVNIHVNAGAPSRRRLLDTLIRSMISRSSESFCIAATVNPPPLFVVFGGGGG